MHVYICTHAHMNIHIYTHLCMHVQTYMHMYICIDIYVHICTHTLMQGNLTTHCGDRQEVNKMGFWETQPLQWG